jgi:hypothetical protein
MTPNKMSVFSFKNDNSNDAISPHWDKRVSSSAAQNGNLEFLKWALKNGCPYEKNGHVHHPSEWTHTLYSSAAKGGHLNIVKWLHESGYGAPCCQEIYYAAYSGNVEILDWIVAHYKDKMFFINSFIGKILFEKGHLDYIKRIYYLHLQKYCKEKPESVSESVLGASSFYTIFLNQHLDIVKWIHEIGFVKDRKALQECLDRAGNNSPIIKDWMRENGYD